MKRTIAMILALMLAMSAIFATTAFAEVISYDLARDYGITQIPEPIELDEEAELQLKEELISIEQFESYTVDYIVEVNYFGTMSDGSKLIRYRTEPEVRTAVVPLPRVIGKYLYYYGNSLDRDSDNHNQILLLKEGKLYSIDNAYTNGIINDNVLDEIAETLNFEIYQPKATQTTEPNIDETATVSVVTPDTATPDTAQNANNSSNGAIPTGESNTAVFVLIITAITAAVWVCAAKRRSCK